jgi:hypothetical protein
VRVDHVTDGHPCFLRHAKVRRRIADRVDDRGRRPAPSAEEVRRGDYRVCVEELAEDHGSVMV